MRGALIAAASIGLAGPALGQHTFSSGDTDYGRHVAFLLKSNLPDPELLKAQAFSELAGELWLAAASALNALDTCWSEPGTDPLAAAQCVNARAVANLAPEALATEIDQYCSYKAQLSRRPAAVAGCFLQSWHSIWGHALGLRWVVERLTACSFPDLIRLRELHVRRTEVHLEQIVTLNALLGQVTARHRGLAYYDTLRPDWAWEQYVQAIAWLEEAQERARKFSDTLAADSPRIKVGTLIAISTAQQEFSRCHRRHPDRAEEWQETFAAYAEGSPPSIPTWINDVPTASDPQPIDVRGAARRTFEAMVRAHETPTPPTKIKADPAAEPGPPTHRVPEAVIQACQKHTTEMKKWTDIHVHQQARLAEITGSVWAGCGDEFLLGAASSIEADLPAFASSASIDVAKAVARRTGRRILAQMIKGGSRAGEVATAAAHGYVASAMCRSQKERPRTGPVTVGIEADGTTVSQIDSEWAPGKVTVGQMKDLIEQSQRNYNRADSRFHIECLSEL